MALLTDLLLLGLAYLLGAIPTGLILGLRLRGVDLRTVGSGNIGATNAWRVLGKGIGTATFLIDVAKGAAGPLLAMLLGAGALPVLPILAGLMVLVGNAFNIFLGGKGGKGVATSLGVLLALAPPAVLIAVVLFVAVLKVSGYVSLGSLTAALAMPILVFFFYGAGPLLLFMLAVSALVIVKHRANIVRLMNGTESKVGKKA